MFYRILAALVAVALIYVTYEIIATYRYYNVLHTPAAPFMAMNNDTGKIPVVQYIDLRCDVCKDNALVMMDYAAAHPDIFYILRPVYKNEDQNYTEARMAIATGLQGKYWETMRTISQYRGAPDLKFYEENASLIGLDLEKLKMDADSGEAADITARNTEAANRADFETTQSLMVGRRLYYLQKPLTEGDVSQMVEAQR